MAGSKDVEQITESILKKLEELGGEVAQVDERSRQSASETPALAGVLDSISSLRTLVPELADGVTDVARGKVWIGIVGHYSHGKSSLLNALLQLPDAPELLPTGDGVVTGMVSRVDFSSTRTMHEFRLLKGDASMPISEEDYRAQVARGSALTGVYAFDLELATQELAQSDLWRNMEKRCIALFDTPGLGGPYFSDANQVSQWMSQFLLLVVCVRADRITKDVATSLTPFLREAPKKILPVVTFWDTWQGCKDYEGISGEEQARARAQQLLETRFPVLGEHAHRAIFVSARQYRNRTEPTPEQSRFVSPSWNIDQLRHALYQEMDPSVLGRVAKLSPFERFRANRLHRRVEDARAQIALAVDRFEQAEGKVSIGDAGPLDEALLEATERMEEPFDRLSDDIESRVMALVPDLGGSVPLNEGVEELNRVVRSCIDDFKRMHARSVKRELEGRLLRTLEDQLDRSGASATKRSALLDRFTREVRALGEALAEAEYERAVRLPGAGQLGTATAGAALKSMLSVGTNPRAWMPLLVCGGLLLLWPVLGVLQSLSEYLSEKLSNAIHLIGLLGLVGAGVSFAVFFAGEWGHIREKSLAEFRKACRNSVRRDALRRAIKETAAPDLDRFRDGMVRISRDIDETADAVGGALRAVRERMRGVKARLEEVARLSRQLEERMR